MTYPIRNVIHGIAHPETILQELGQASAAGHVVTVRDIQPQPDGRVGAIYVEHGPAQPVILSPSRSSRSLTSRDLVMAFAGIFVVAFCAAVVFLTLTIITWIKTHAVETSLFVVVLGGVAYFVATRIFGIGRGGDL